MFILSEEFYSTQPCFLPSVSSTLKSGSCRLLCLFFSLPLLYLFLPHTLAPFLLALIRNKPLTLFYSSSAFSVPPCNFFHFVIPYFLPLVFVYLSSFSLPSIHLTLPFSRSCFNHSQVVIRSKKNSKLGIKRYEVYF